MRYCWVESHLRGSCLEAWIISCSDRLWYQEMSEREVPFAIWLDENNLSNLLVLRSSPIYASNVPGSVLSRSSDLGFKQRLDTYKDVHMFHSILLQGNS